MEGILKQFSEHGLTGLVAFALLLAYVRLIPTLEGEKGTVKLFPFSIFCAILVAVLFSNGQQESLDFKVEQTGVVTIEKANGLMSRLETAIKNKDVDGVISLFSEDAIIEIVYIDGSRKAFSRSDYKAYLSLVFSVLSKYELENLHRQSFIVKGGEQIVFSSLSHEKANVTGPFYEGNLSQQISIVEERNGLPMITSVRASQVERATNVGKGRS